MPDVAGEPVAVDALDVAQGVHGQHQGAAVDVFLTPVAVPVELPTATLVHGEVDDGAPQFVRHIDPVQRHFETVQRIVEEQGTAGGRLDPVEPGECAVSVVWLPQHELPGTIAATCDSAVPALRGTDCPGTWITDVRRGQLVPFSLAPSPYHLEVIADNRRRFRDFRPYVAAVDERGLVAFQAQLEDGSSGVFAGQGDAVQRLDAPAATDGQRQVVSHPDINRAGDVCFYAHRRSGVQEVVLVRDNRPVLVADSSGALREIGPLGPTMNRAGVVAFRATDRMGHHGIFTGDGQEVIRIADTSGSLTGFDGLPVIDDGGAVVFRAQRADGSQCVYCWRDGALSALADTGEQFVELGRFPFVASSGPVAFVGQLRAGVAGVFRMTEDGPRLLIDDSGRFASFRGVLCTGDGEVIFYATPRGGRLGIYRAREADGRPILALGDRLQGAEVTAFALNPVSINSRAQLAIRVELDGGRQLIVRADPAI